MSSSYYMICCLYAEICSEKNNIYESIDWLKLCVADDVIELYIVVPLYCG